MQKLLLKSDFAVKELFAHETVRRQFLSDVLGIPAGDIKAVRIENPFLRKVFRRQKQGILDIVLVLNDDTKIDIEMQVYRQKHWTKRDLYYLARMYTDDLLVGENYGKLRRCVSISLLDFTLFPDTSKYHSVYRLRDESGKELTDLWEVHIIELCKPLEGRAVDDWIRLFNADNREELEMIAIKNESMREVIGVVKDMGLRRTLKWIYDDYWKSKRDRWAEDEYVRDEGIAIGRAEGLSIGKIEGKAEGKAESIIHLLKSTCTDGNVPEALIEKIKAEKKEEILDRWLLSAARAESVGQFRERENL